MAAMVRGIRLFKILGIRISLDYTWFLVFAVFSWSLAYGYFPFHSPGFGHGTYLAMGLVSALLLFACVLIHEIAHSYTANRLGLDIREITLFIFGGVAQLSREPDDPITELKIAVAGPAASLVLAVLFHLGALAVAAAGDYPILLSVVEFLRTINIVLLLFNMIPGFPLDGGRVLRALWWHRTGDIRRATEVASSVGKGFALFLIVTGFLNIFAGRFVSGLWSVFIGVFLQQAAEGSYRQLLFRMTLAGMRVRDVMTRDVVTVSEEMTVREAVEEYFLRHHYASFPVVSAGGTVVGILNFMDVKGVDRERWSSTRVCDVMERLTPERILGPDEMAVNALARMAAEGVGRFPVMEGGRLVGILTRRDIMRLIELKAELRG